MQELEDIGMPKFVFVIDTNKYAGSFERQLCAYMTGMVGECEVGDEEAEEFAKDHPGDNPLENMIEMPPDEHGCHRPVLLWSTPGWFNNGVGGHFRPGQEKEAHEQFVRYCLEEAEQAEKKRPYADPKENERLKQEWLERSKEPLTKHPAYNSVGICFVEKPSDELIRLMIKRALSFTRNEITYRFEGKSQITGFRLIAVNMTATELDISGLLPKP